MINQTIGHIILKGGTSEELRKEFPDFPISPTKDYFLKLGYRDSTAKKYLIKLRQNDKAQLDDSIKKTMEPSENSNSEPKIKFLKSENVDFSNLLVDTCALEPKETRELLEQAKYVTFIKATIEEMDKKKNCKNAELAAKIRLYTEKILFNPNKYMLSSFPGLNNENYPDNILLQYLLIFPKQIRPTLLTADKNLAIKAQMWDLPYILYLIPKKANKKVKQKEKRLGYGVWEILEDDGTIYIINKGFFPLTIIHQDGTETAYTGEKMRVVKGEQICVAIKEHKKIIPKYLEIK